MTRVYRERFTHRPSGYLFQSAGRGGRAHESPRGSGTALAAYLLVLRRPAPRPRLAGALARTGHTSLVGFGAVREYAPGAAGHGDIDSGPVVLGVSVSATGFALAAARQSGDRDRYHALYRTAALFGVPVRAQGRERRFVTGGALGDAILLAMLTARPA